MTPQLLMLSGVGPAGQLRRHAIDCVADLPGVGENLIDHPEVPIVALANGPYGYYRQGVGWRMLRNGLQFRLFGSGPITSAGVEAGAFVNPTEPEAEPTIQAFCVPIVYLDRDTPGLVKDGYGVTVTTVVVKPKSRGFVRLRSADPDQMPAGFAPSSQGSSRPPHDDRRPALLPARVPDRPARRAHRARRDPGPERSQRRGDREPLPTCGEDQLSSERHVPDGDKPRSACGAGFRNCGSAASRISECATSPRCRTSTRATPTPRR